VAPHLGLDAEALIALARGAWRPEPVSVAGFEGFNTPYEDMTVNSYVAFDPFSKEAVAFDTGADADPMLDFLKQNGLRLTKILITHTHGDHILELDRLREKTGATAHVGDREGFEHAESFSAGTGFVCGRLRIDTRLTWGHARGGITYVIHGLDRPVAVVGDALFAGSMGGGMVSYDDALRTSRSEILSLADETVIAPGHGPLTTVAEEKAHNPFFC
jgi:hydroxyacylglutathione hydrolase